MHLVLGAADMYDDKISTIPLWIKKKQTTWYCLINNHSDYFKICCHFKRAPNNCRELFTESKLLYHAAERLFHNFSRGYVYWSTPQHLLVLISQAKAKLHAKESIIILGLVLL